MPNYHRHPSPAIVLLLAALTPTLCPAQAPDGPAQAQAPTAPAPAVVPPTPPTEAEKTLDEAIAKLKAVRSVSADITQKVDILSEKFTLSGRYLKDANYRVYLLLSLDGKEDDPAGQMLQVCDGATLWDYTKILGSQSCRKLQIGEIVRKLDGPDVDPELRRGFIDGMGFAGPEALLVGLRKSMDFDQKEEQVRDGKAVWVLRGKWKDNRGLVPGNQGEVSPNAMLPPYIPRTVALTLGKDDGWPYQVVLKGRKPSLIELQRDDRPIGQDGRRIGVKAPPKRVDPTEIVLTYSNVQINPALGAENFAFQPGNLQPLDGTNQVLAALDNAIRDRAAAQRAEAAKEGGALPALPATGAPSAAPPPGGTEFRSTSPRPPG